MPTSERQRNVFACYLRAGERGTTAAEVARLTQLDVEVVMQFTVRLADIGQIERLGSIVSKVFPPGEHTEWRAT